MVIIWQDPAVQASFIGAIGTFIATVVAALCAAVIGKQITGRKKLQEDLKLAVNDIAFLLAVEEEHCGIHRLGSGESNKMRVRNEVTGNGLFWSGAFTPGRVRRRLAMTNTPSE